MGSLALQFSSTKPKLEEVPEIVTQGVGRETHSLTHPPHPTHTGDKGQGDRVTGPQKATVCHSTGVSAKL